VTQSLDREAEFKQLYETLKAKYIRKKKSTNERKNSLKSEISTLKRQLAEAIQKISTLSKEQLSNQPDTSELCYEIETARIGKNINRNNGNSLSG